MGIEQVRRIALSFPSVTEEPHHHFSSFRVAGKIFATVPPEETHVHLFVDDQKNEMMLDIDPLTYEKLWWGKKVMGLRANLETAREQDIQDLLQNAWARKAPKRLLTD